MKKKFIPIVALASLLTLGGVATAVTSCDNQNQNNQDVKVSDVTISLSKTTLQVGEKIKATVTINPTDATNKEYIISSSNESVASVNGDEITAISKGTTEITVKTKDGDKTDSVTLTVTEQVIELTDPKLVYDGEKEFSVNAGEDLTLPTIKAISGDGKTDISNLIEVSDANDSKSINAEFTKFNSKIAGVHTLSYYVEEGEGEDIKSDELEIKITVNPASEEGFSVTSEDNDLNNIKDTTKVFKENFAEGTKSTLYKTLGDANDASYLSGTNEAVGGNSLIINMNKTSGSAANSLFLTLNDAMPRGVSKNYIVEFDFKIVSGSNFGNVYFGLRWDGSNGINVQFANGKTSNDGVVHFKHKFTEANVPSDGNAGFFFFKLAADQEECKIAIDNFQISTSDPTSFTKVTPTSEQLTNEGGFTFNWKEKGSSFNQGETIAIDNIEDENIKNAIKGKTGFETNVMHLTNRDNHTFEGLNSTNLIAGKKLKISYTYYSVFDESLLVLPMASGVQSGTINEFDTTVIEGNIKKLSFTYNLKSGDDAINFYPTNAKFDIYMGNMTVELLENTEVKPADETENGFKVGHKFKNTSRSFGSEDKGSAKMTNDATLPSNVTGDGFNSKASLLEYKNATDNTMEWCRCLDSNGKSQLELGNTYKITVAYYMENYDASRWCINFDNAKFLDLDVGEGYHKKEINWVAEKTCDFFSFYIPGGMTVTDAKVYIAYTEVELIEIAK